MAALLTTSAHLGMRDMLDRLIVLSIVFKTDLDKPLGGSLCIRLHLSRCSSLIAFGVFGLEIDRSTSHKLIVSLLLHVPDGEEMAKRCAPGKISALLTVYIHDVAVIHAEGLVTLRHTRAWIPMPLRLAFCSIAWIWRFGNHEGRLQEFRTQ